jgi:competence protein ComEC
VRWVFRGAAATACATALLLPLLIGFAPRTPAGGELTVTLLSVGAGQCAVVRMPSGKTILIDAGSSTIADLQRRCLAPFLRHTGVSRIDSIFVSHANIDHFSAVAQAAQAYAVREVLITPMFRQHAQKNHAARQMLRRLADLHCPVSDTTAGRRIQLDDDCQLEVLWPPAGSTLDANDTSQVLKLTCRGRTILFTGDIQSPAESALLADPATLSADVLITPHHGSAELTTGKFLDAVGPAAALLASDDRTPSGKQRAFDQLVAGRQLYRTHECGAVTVHVTKDGTVSVTTYRKR